MDILGQSALFVAVTSFSLGFSVLARNVKNKLFIAYAVLTTFVSFWALCFFLSRIWPESSFYQFHLFFNLWLGPAGLTFIHVMTRVNDKLSRRLLDISVILAISLTVALVLHMESIPMVLQAMYFEPGVILIQTLHLMNTQKRVPTVGFGRRNLIYLGALTVLATSMMDHIVWLPNFIPSFGNLALSVYLYFVSKAISQQRLLNFGALFSRFLVLLALALTLNGVYFLLVAWVENSPGLLFLNSFIASFLILTLLDPLRALVTYFTQRLLTQKHLKLQQTIQEAQRKLAGALDSGTLFQSVLLTAEQILHPEWAALFVLRQDGTKYRRVRTSGTDPQADSIREILADHPLLHYCEKLHRKGQLPIVLDQILESEIDRTASRAQRDTFAAHIQSLRALRANLLIPLIDSGKILGFVTLNVTSPPEPWGSNWGLLTMLYPYFEQGAKTLRSMEVFTRQREKERLATLGEMSAGLAHEIRNPLGAIKGAAQYLDPSSDRPESKFLKIIIEEADRLNRVVTQFLDYSKPPATDFKPVEVSQLVERTVEVMRAGIPSQIELQFQPAPNKYQVSASAEQMRQVLLNLLQNSAKALEGKHSGKISVSVEAEGQAEVGIVVEDNGAGIKRENLEKLFIPFFTTSPDGTGLGLSISQKIVEAHGGRIEVATEEGRFTRFSVVLPTLKEVAL